MAGGADIAQPALAIAARAGKAELHRARHLRHVAGAVALRADRGCATDGTRAIARLTNFLARDIQPHLGAADGLPKVDIQSVFQVGAFFGTRARLFRAPAAEELAENVAKSSGASARLRLTAMVIHVIRKIEATKTHARLTSARAWPSAGTARRDVVRIETILIVNLALLRIAQDVISFLNLLEALFGGLIARVQIWMVLARQLAVRLAYLVFFGVARHTERFVIILFACGWHKTVPKSPGSPIWRARGRINGAYFLSSTSTNSASTTLSLGLDSLAPAPLPSAPGAPGGGVPPGWLEALYIASASLWLAVSSFEVA